MGLVLAALLVGALGYILWFAIHSVHVADSALKSANHVSSDIPKTQPVTSFDTCKKAPGSKLLQTFPEQCVTSGGKKFTGPITSKTYTSKTEKASFTYPAEWQAVDPVVQPNDASADAVGLRSPDGKVTVSWVSLFGGVGGACDAEANLGADGACPSSVVTASQAIAGAPGLYVVEGYITQDNQKFYPFMAVEENKLAVSQRELGLEFYPGKHNGGSNVLFAIGGISKTAGVSGYASITAAKAFLAGDDAAAARQIMLSLSY